MPYGYRRRFARPMVRRKPKWMWVRDHINNVGPVSPNSPGLRNDWRASMGLVFNLPDIVIWRIRIRIAISIHLSSAAYTATSGVGIGLYVDNVVQTQLGGPMGNPYGQHYLLFDFLYLAQTLQGGPVAAATTTNLYMMYGDWDMKGHRKVALQEELWLQLVPEGVVAMDTFNVTYNLLLRVP